MACEIRQCAVYYAIIMHDSMATFGWGEATGGREIE
jgi:hypothetical protein